MESFWRSTAIHLGKQWKAVATVVFVITLVLVGLGASRIDFATGQDSYLNPSSQIAIDNVEFQDEFGGETVILLFSANEPGVDVADLFVGENLDTLRRLQEDLAIVGNVRSIITPLVSLTWSNELVNGAGRSALIAASTRDEAGGAARRDDISVGLARLGEIPAEDQVVGNPAWNDLLIYGNDGFTVGDDGVVAPPDEQRAIRLSLASTYPNPQTAVGGVVLQGNLSLDDQSQATLEVLEVLDGVEFAGFDLTVTGSPVYLKEINDYLKGGMLTLGIAAIAVMAIVLGLLFKVRWRLLPLLAVIFGVLWTFSIMGLIGIDLSLVTISGLPILIGVGIDFAIQIHNRVEEEVTLDHETHPIGETLANLAPPLIAATLAGVAAFLALRLSLVPMIRDFGILLAVGIAVLVVIGIVVTSSALGIREYVDPSKERGVSVVEKIVVKLGSLPVKAGLALVLLSLGLFVGGIAAETRTRIESDPIKWIDQGSEVVADVGRLEDETGFSTTLGVIVKANNIYDQDVIDLIHEFTIDAEQRPEVVSTSSLVNTMAKIITIPGATVIPPTVAEIVGAAEVMPPDVERALVNDDGTATQVNLRLAAASLDDRAVLVAELERDLQARIEAMEVPADSILLDGLPDGQTPVRATPAGLATVGIGLLENLSANRAVLTYFALSLAGAFLVLRFRSLTRALLALVPVFLGVGASSIIVGLLGITLSPLTTVSGPLIIAACTEFSVLIMGRYLEERQRGLSIVDANHTAASRTGRAFFVSAATTIGGFATLLVSPLPLLRDFGIVVTLNVAIALAAALIVMPPMLSWVDSKGWLGLDGQLDQPGSVRLAAPFPGDQAILFGVGVVGAAVAVGGVYSAADTSSGTATASVYEFVPLPTTTTSTTTTTTTPPGEETPTTEPGVAGPLVDPSGFPSDAPVDGLAGPFLYGALTSVGVPGNEANCAIAQILERSGGEDALLALDPLAGGEAVLAIVRGGAADCGIDEALVEQAIAATFAG